MNFVNKFHLLILSYCVLPSLFTLISSFEKIEYVDLCEVSSSLFIIGILKILMDQIFSPAKCKSQSLDWVCRCAGGLRGDGE